MFHPLLALITTLFITPLSAVLPRNYQSLSAQAKQTLQWNQILESQYRFDQLPALSSSHRPDNLTLLGNPTYLATSFLHKGDEMPGTRRRMTMSPVGVICKVSFRTFRNSTSRFTGLFHSGGIGVIRLALHLSRTSTVREIGDRATDFAPTAVMKIYIDGEPSRNFHYIKDMVGQGANRNYFLNNMSNIAGRRPDESPVILEAFMRTIALLPGDALSRPSSPYNLGLYEQAAVYSNGTTVTDGRVVAPWEEILVPNPRLAIPPDSANDFRVDVNRVVTVGSVLYTVHARRWPDDGGGTDGRRPDNGGGTDGRRSDDGGGTARRRPDNGGGTVGRRSDDGGGTDGRRPDNGGGTVGRRSDDGGGTAGRRSDDGGGMAGRRPDNGGGTVGQRSDDGGGTGELIGEIVAESRCIPSRYGDEVIFFRQSAEQWRP
ncbi:hypothetical protein BV898_17148 [Hypsibius exemplaris]|uniref:Uncharacterized protein n=1 Tax=Hypsibius exemplaris TaxID=2072580 RepID=A0A9X6RMB0_HYPEX|nr:hypothetical protein BV898_17148 [Hypsibius exemplaris]